MLCCERYSLHSEPGLCLLWQVERNLHDAMNVTRNVMLDPRLVPGGGAAEMALAHVRSYTLLFCM